MTKLTMIKVSAAFIVGFSICALIFWVGGADLLSRGNGADIILVSCLSCGVLLAAPAGMP